MDGELLCSLSGESQLMGGTNTIFNKILLDAFCYLLLTELKVKGSCSHIKAQSSGAPTPRHFNQNEGLTPTRSVLLEGEGSMSNVLQSEPDKVQEKK